MGSGADQKTESEPATERGLTSLKTQQRECARLHVAGWAPKRIAAELGYKTPTIRAWLRQPVVQEYLKVLEAVRERGALAEFERLQRNYLPEAVDTVVDVMRDGGRDADRLGAAESILDRTGLPKVSRQHMDRSSQPTVHIHLTESQAKAFRKLDEGEAAREARRNEVIACQVDEHGKQITPYTNGRGEVVDPDTYWSETA